MTKQDYQTPKEFLRVVEERFGEIVFDLAAVRETSAARRKDHYFGPDHHDVTKRDGLIAAWPPVERGTLWLNPPFSRVEPWIRRCHRYTTSGPHGGTLLSLTLASVGSEWFRKLVHGHALVMPLSPRIKFVGEAQPFNRDLMLCAWGGGRVGFEPWRWRS